MYTPYTNLPENSRVWIYQADRKLLNEDIEHISAKAIMFIDQWTRHGDDLKGSFTIKYKRFLVLVVDESLNSASGCSIDASVRFIQELEKELNVDFMNKMNVAFKSDDTIKMVSLSDFQELAKTNEITKDTIVFNNLVATKHDFEHHWEIPAHKSWHQRFLA